MAKPYMTSDTLVTSIKRRAMIPTSQSTFNEQDFLDIINEEIQIGILPSILRFHEEYLVYEKEEPLVPNQSSYLIPKNAIGNKLRDVFYKDAQGNLREMTRVSPEDRAYYQSSGASTYFNKFYIQNGSVVLLPNVESNATGSLVYLYFKKPAQLVKTKNAGTITAINTLTGVITLSAFPTLFSASDSYDLQETKSPHRTLVSEITPTAINSSSKTITFDPTELSSELAIGDVIAFTNEGIIPQIPDELHSVIAQRAACRCLEALGDAQGLADANKKLEEMEVQMGSLIDNRVEGAPVKVVNRNSIIRQGKSRRRNGY